MNVQQVHEKVLNITSCLENTTPTKNTTSPHWKKLKLKGQDNSIELKFVCVAVDV